MALAISFFALICKKGTMLAPKFKNPPQNYFIFN